MDKENKEAKRLTNPIPRTPSRGKDEFGDEPSRWCGCPIPRDYPKIDIHNSGCKRRRWLKDPSVGNTGVPKVYLSGRKLSGSDAPRSVTPTHQTFFSHEYTHLLLEQNSVWLAMAKRFDEKHHKH